MLSIIYRLISNFLQSRISLENVFMFILNKQTSFSKVLKQMPSVTSLSIKTLLPYDLFHDYKHKDIALYYVGLSEQLSKKLIALFYDVLEICQNIQYENNHQNEMARTIATTYMYEEEHFSKNFEGNGAYAL